MATSATALVQTGPSRVEFQEIPLPRLGEGELLIRVEANGLCHSDLNSFTATTSLDQAFGASFPRIIGHEIVGVVEEMGQPASSARRLKVGDRVAVNPFIGCGSCPRCLRGEVFLCMGTGRVTAYSTMPLSVKPGLWGGYSTHVFVPKNGVLYPFAPEISALDATLWNPISAGFQWAVMDGGVGIGSRVLIMGPGQRGLGSIFGTRMAGAAMIAMTGLSSDAHKLELARDFGVDATIDVEREDLVERAMELTGGEGFDVVLDTTPHATQPVLDALKVARIAGTVVFVGIKGQAVDGFPLDLAIAKRLRLLAVRNQNNDAYQQAADLISSQQFPVGRMRTHVFGFDRLEHALNVLDGKVPGEKAINVVVTPTMTDPDH